MIFFQFLLTIALKIITLVMLQNYFFSEKNDEAKIISSFLYESRGLVSE